MICWIIMIRFYNDTHWLSSSARNVDDINLPVWDGWNPIEVVLGNGADGSFTTYGPLMGLDVLCQVSIKRRFMREKKDQVPGATYVVKHVGW